MRIILIKSILLLFMVNTCLLSTAQKKQLIEDRTEITEAATAELDRAMEAPEGRLYLFRVEYPITGSYTFDITIREKGDVASVFALGNEGGSINSQNSLKDFVSEFEFGFKMPKGKRYKFQYIFNFN